MKRTGLLIGSFLLGSLGMICIPGRSQHPTTAAQASEPGAKTVSITAYKPPSSIPSNQLQTCPAKVGSHPEADGIYRVGDHVLPPVPTNTVEARLTIEARKAAAQNPNGRLDAVSLIGLVVDKEGNPQEVCVRKIAGYGLDEEAVNAVKKYSFRPATTSGVPVAVRLTIEVNFKD
jgi:TonB family protein